MRSNSFRSGLAVSGSLLATPSAILAQDGDRPSSRQTAKATESARRRSSDIIVTGQTLPSDEQGYVAHRSNAGSKTDTPIIEVPQLISIVSAEQITAQDAETVGQALRYVSGVQTEPFGFDPRHDQFIIRGFAENVVGKYRDCLRQLNGAFSLFVDEPYGLERLRVPYCNSGNCTFTQARTVLGSVKFRW